MQEGLLLETSFFFSHLSWSNDHVSQVCSLFKAFKITNSIMGHQLTHVRKLEYPGEYRVFSHAVNVLIKDSHITVRS